MSGGRHENITKPDRSPKTIASLSRKKMRHMENTSIARYVWLPVEWEGGKPVVRWHDEWRVEDKRQEETETRPIFSVGSIDSIR